MGLRKIQHLCLFFFVFSLFMTRGSAAEKDEDELGAHFSWMIKWEEEVGQGKIQEKGSCTIQVSGTIVKYQEAFEIVPGLGSAGHIAYIYALKEEHTEALRWNKIYIDNAPTPGLKSGGYIFRGIHYN